jgi:hypothetical protein
LGFAIPISPRHYAGSFIALAIFTISGTVTASTKTAMIYFNQGCRKGRLPIKYPSSTNTNMKITDLIILILRKG